MWTAIGAFFARLGLGAIGDFIVKIIGAFKPDPAIAPSQQAGAAQQALNEAENSNAIVAKARAASDAADAAGVRDPASLRAPDPDSRD